MVVANAKTIPTATEMRSRLTKRMKPLPNQKRSVLNKVTWSEGARNGNFTMRINRKANKAQPAAIHNTSGTGMWKWRGAKRPANGPRDRAKRPNHDMLWFASVRRYDSQVSMTRVLESIICAKPKVAPCTNRNSMTRGKVAEGHPPSKRYHRTPRHAAMMTIDQRHTLLRR